jgi:hypothetical protein
LVNIAIEKFISSVTSYPKLKIFGIAQNDGDGGWCQCPNCVAWDGAQAGRGVYSNRLIHFINLVADGIKTSYPTKYIGTYAYGETKLPPDINAASNVAITFGTGGRNYMRKLTDPTDPTNAALVAKLNGWLSKAQNVHFWEYYFYPNMAFCPAPYARTICQEYADLKSLGIKGVCSETYPNIWPGLRLVSYTAARAGWDTSLDYNDILNDFCFSAYGPAASYMKSYYEHVPSLGMYGAAAQLFPTSFSSADLNTLDSYVASAISAAKAFGTQANIDNIAEANSMHTKFKSLSIDPATISGIGPNLVFNPGAESGADNWITDIYQDVGDYEFSISSTVSHSGNNSFKTECTGAVSPTARWYQTNIPLTAGKKYAARFWIKASGGANGIIELYPGGPYIQVGWVDTNNQWVQIVVPEFTAASSTLEVFLGSCSVGTDYFDDIFIAKLPD